MRPASADSAGRRRRQFRYERDGMRNKGEVAERWQEGRLDALLKLVEMEAEKIVEKKFSEMKTSIEHRLRREMRREIERRTGGKEGSSEKGGRRKQERRWKGEGGEGESESEREGGVSRMEKNRHEEGRKTTASASNCSGGEGGERQRQEGSEGEGGSNKGRGAASDGGSVCSESEDDSFSRLLTTALVFAKEKVEEGKGGGREGEKKGGKKKGMKEARARRRQYSSFTAGQQRRKGESIGRSQDGKGGQAVRDRIKARQDMLPANRVVRHNVEREKRQEERNALVFRSAVKDVQRQRRVEERSSLRDMIRKDRELHRKLGEMGQSTDNDVNVLF